MCVKYSKCFSIMIGIISVFTFLSVFYFSKASAYSLKDVLAMSPAFHLVRDIYVLISGNYYPISYWLSFETSQLKVNKTLNVSGDIYANDISVNKICLGTKCKSSWPTGLNITHPTGDCDMDGVITSNDALCIIQYNAGLNNNCNIVNCDVTGDGTVDIQDAMTILQLINGDFTHAGKNAPFETRASIYPVYNGTLTADKINTNEICLNGSCKTSWPAAGGGTGLFSLKCSWTCFSDNYNCTSRCKPPQCPSGTIDLGTGCAATDVDYGDYAFMSSGYCERWCEAVHPVFSLKCSWTCYPDYPDNTSRCKPPQCPSGTIDLGTGCAATGAGISYISGYCERWCELS